MESQELNQPRDGGKEEVKGRGRTSGSPWNSQGEHAGECWGVGRKSWGRRCAQRGMGGAVSRLKAPRFLGAKPQGPKGKQQARAVPYRSSHASHRPLPPTMLPKEPDTGWDGG